MRRRPAELRLSTQDWFLLTSRPQGVYPVSMPRRTHLRTRVLLLTGAFALVLFAITFGLSWRARVSQERWSHLIGVEMQAIANLDSLVRQQNAFRARLPEKGNYRIVEQIVDDSPALRSLNIRSLRAKMRAFSAVIAEPHPRPQDVRATSDAVVLAADALARERKAIVAQNLPELDRDTRAMMISGLAVAWIVVILSFAAAQSALRKVVRPIEELSRAADQIAGGDVNAEVPVRGDLEIARLGVAVAEMRNRLRDHARTDELTGLPNFRAFRERIDEEIGRAARYPSPFGVMVLDLDHFKKYNDTFGHLAGNDALQRVSVAIRQSVRIPDFAARYGGEEFAVILPETVAPDAAAVAERVRSAIETLPVPSGEIPVTVSIGVAMFPADGRTPEALFHAADERLYTAKREGRNRVVLVATESAATA
jgi:diguanylate cyclase (GGDEF)-like protein